MFSSEKCCIKKDRKGWHLLLKKFQFNQDDFVELLDYLLFIKIDWHRKTNFKVCIKKILGLCDSYAGLTRAFENSNNGDRDNNVLVVLNLREHNLNRLGF